MIGFDDIEEAAEHVPPLTTMRIPLFEIGRRAADLVLDVVESDHEDIAGRSEVLPVELVRRGERVSARSRSGGTTASDWHVVFCAPRAHYDITA